MWPQTFPPDVPDVPPDVPRSGVNPRTAMELMRHSEQPAPRLRRAGIRLTTAIYRHIELPDTAGAVDRLPGVNAMRDSGRWATAI